MSGTSSDTSGSQPPQPNTSISQGTLQPRIISGTSPQIQLPVQYASTGQQIIQINNLGVQNQSTGLQLNSNTALINGQTVLLPRNLGNKTIIVNNPANRQGALLPNQQNANLTQMLQNQQLSAQNTRQVLLLPKSAAGSTSSDGTQQLIPFQQQATLLSIPNASFIPTSNINFIAPQTSASTGSRQDSEMFTTIQNSKSPHVKSSSKKASRNQTGATSNSPVSSKVTASITNSSLTSSVSSLDSNAINSKTNPSGTASPMSMNSKTQSMLSLEQLRNIMKNHQQLPTRNVTTTTSTTTEANSILGKDKVSSNITAPIISPMRTISSAKNSSAQNEADQRASATNNIDASLENSLKILQKQEPGLFQTQSEQESNEIPNQGNETANRQKALQQSLDIQQQVLQQTAKKQQAQTSNQSILVSAPQSNTSGSIILTQQQQQAFLQQQIQQMQIPPQLVAQMNPMNQQLYQQLAMLNQQKLAQLQMQQNQQLLQSQSLQQAGNMLRSDQKNLNKMANDNSATTSDGTKQFVDLQKQIILQKLAASASSAQNIIPMSINGTIKGAQALSNSTNHQLGVQNGISGINLVVFITLQCFRCLLVLVILDLTYVCSFV